MTSFDNDDDLLSAYLDNELDEATHKQVSSRLMAEPELREKYEQLKKLQRSFEQAFSQLPSQEISAGLAKTLDLETSKNSNDTSPQSGIISDKGTIWGLPIAASVAIVFLLAGYFVSNQSNSNNQWAHVEAALSDAKEMTFQNVANNTAKIIVLQSFEHVDGRLCREYQLQSDEELSHAIACQVESGWHQEISESLESNSNIYQPATAASNEVKQYLDKYLLKTTSFKE